MRSYGQCDPSVNEILQSVAPSGHSVSVILQSYTSFSQCDPSVSKVLQSVWPISPRGLQSVGYFSQCGTSLSMGQSVWPSSQCDLSLSVALQSLGSYFSVALQWLGLFSQCAPAVSMVRQSVLPVSQCDLSVSVRPFSQRSPSAIMKAYSVKGFTCMKPVCCRMIYIMKPVCCKGFACMKLNFVGIINQQTRFTVPCLWAKHNCPLRLSLCTHLRLSVNRDSSVVTCSPHPDDFDKATIHLLM